jgi:hypothetical protein
MDLAFDQDWSQIQLVKSFFEQFVVSRTNNEEEVHKIGITVSELLENAVKYSNKRGIRIVIRQIERTGTFILYVWNHAAKSDILRLKERLKEMRSMDSLKYYIYRMRESVKDKLASPGLGLARIYHEANAEISARITEKKLVEIKVKIKLN